MDEFLILSRLVHIAAAMFLFGASLFSLYVGSRLSKRRRVRAAFDRWLGNALLVTAVLAFLSALAWWDALAVSLGGGWAEGLSGETLEAVLFDTKFGQVWIWRLANSALLMFVLLLARRGEWTLRINLLVAGLAAALLASLAGVGHAAVQKGTMGAAHQAAQAIHLVAAGVWVGGLVPLGYVLGKASIERAGEWAEYVAQVLRRFSRVGYFAVSLVLFSGCIIGWLMIGGFSGLFDTLYGRVVLVKFCLFSLMTAIALFNRFYLMPRISAARKGAKRAPDPLRLLWRSVMVEQGVALAALAAASVLGTIQPLAG
jgi:putative copper resistance protein D